MVWLEIETIMGRNHMNNKVKPMAWLPSLVMLSLAGCAPAKQEEVTQAADFDQTVSTQPVTLKLLVNAVRLSDLEFQTIFYDR